MFNKFLTKRITTQTKKYYSVANNINKTITSISKKVFGITEYDFNGFETYYCYKPLRVSQLTPLGKASAIWKIWPYGAMDSASDF